MHRNLSLRLKRSGLSEATDNDAMKALQRGFA